VIVVAGEALVDLIVAVDGSLTAVPGGGPYNSARTIGRLGGDVRFLCRLSRDRFGEMLRAGLRSSGVGLESIGPTDAPTTLALAEIDSEGSASYRFYLEATSVAGLSASEAMDLLGAGVDAVHLGGIVLTADPVADAIEAVAAGARAQGALVSFDPNCRPLVVRDAAEYRRRVERLVELAHVVKVSEDDLRYLYPDRPTTKALEQVMSRGPRAVLLTSGSGPVTMAAGGRRRTVGVPAVEVVDTIGAGDAFGGAFVHHWLHTGATIDDLDDIDRVESAVRWAVDVAAFTCTRAGADPPTLAELDTWPDRAA
jgi:fructokinase